MPTLNADIATATLAATCLTMAVALIPTPPNAISLCHFLMPFPNAISLCHFLVPFPYAISLCHFLMPFPYAISLCHFLMPFPAMLSVVKFNLTMAVALLLNFLGFLFYFSGCVQ